MLIGSLVEFHVELHSCLCFSHLEKLVLKAGSTPPQYLAVCRASLAFSYRNPDNFSILGGSIKNGSASSIASQHLMDRLRFCSWFCWVGPRHLLDTSAVDDHFLDTCICQDLLLALKRKSTLAWNPLHSETSSSFDPTLSHIRFRDDDAFKTFSENFSRQGIHLER